MKKLLSILLVVVLFYSIIGFYLNFEIEQYWIKKEIKHYLINKLPEEELTIIKIPSKDYRKITWTEEGSEFRYNGNMFDVYKIKSTKDSSYYYCFDDIKESTLLTHLDKLVKEQTDHTKSRNIQKKQVFNYLFQATFTNPKQIEKSCQYTIYTTHYSSIFKDVLSPPPKPALLFPCCLTEV